MSSEGLIVEAGSPAVQFELQRSSDGTTYPEWPIVIWIDRTPRGAAAVSGCQCKVSFGVLDEQIEAVEDGCRPVVCPCMGRFIE